MCVAPVLGLVSAGVQGYAAIKEGDAEQSAARSNAFLADAQATDAYKRGAIEAGAVRQQGYAATQRVLAGTAANGVETSTGSAADALAGSTANTEVDVARIKANAAREAWGYKMEADQYRAQGQRAKRQAVLGLLGAGLSGVGSFASFGGVAAQKAADNEEKAWREWERQKVGGK